MKPRAHGRMTLCPAPPQGPFWCPGRCFGCLGRCWIFARGEPPRRRQAQGLSPMRPWAMASCSVLLYYYTLILYYYITSSILFYVNRTSFHQIERVFIKSCFLTPPPPWGGATAAAATAAAEEFSDRFQPPSHHAQGLNIAFGFPSLRCI